MFARLQGRTTETPMAERKPEDTGSWGSMVVIGRLLALVVVGMAWIEGSEKPRPSPNPDTPATRAVK